jgi:hypothetical protein
MVQVSDSQAHAAIASLSMSLEALGFTTPGALPGGSTTTAYSQTFSAAGGTSPYTFSSPNLPVGLSFAAATLSGTPKTVGSSGFTVWLSDATGFSTSSSFLLVVTGPPSQLVVGGGALTGGKVGGIYSQAITAVGGAPPYNWAIIGGALPTGLSLNGPSGVISGVSSAAGTFTFTAQATDISNGSRAAIFTITINPQPLNISGLRLPNGIVGSTYPLQILTGSGGIPPFTFAVEDGTPGTVAPGSTQLPQGLSLSNGQISGIPTTSGTFNFSITMTDAESPPATITSPVQMIISPAAGANLILSSAGLSFNLTAGAVGLPTPYSVTVQSSVVQELLNYSVVANPAVSWLDVTGGGATPGSIGIALDPSALNLGASSAPLSTSVVVTCLAPSPCAGNSQTIMVSLSVTAPPPQLTFNTNLVQFSTSALVPNPISEQVAIQNIGGGSAVITSASAADSWLTRRRTRCSSCRTFGQHNFHRQSRNSGTGLLSHHGDHYFLRRNHFFAGIAQYRAGSVADSEHHWRAVPVHLGQRAGKYQRLVPDGRNRR